MMQNEYLARTGYLDLYYEIR